MKIGMNLNLANIVPAQGWSAWGGKHIKPKKIRFIYFFV